MNYSLSIPLISDNMVRILYWTVNACYSAIIIGLWLFLMVDYPDSKIGSQIGQRINITTGVMWVALVLISTAVTGFSIFKIFDTMKEL